METGVIQVDFKDGRLFRIFYANSTQKKKIYRKLNEIKDKVEIVKTITNGIHTLNQFNEIVKHI